MRNPFRYFKTSPEIIRLAVMMYVRFPLSLRQVEDLLHERGIDISHETVRVCRLTCQTLYPSNQGTRTKSGAERPVWLGVAAGPES